MADRGNAGESTPLSPWRAGRLDGRAGPPHLLFGRMYEDWRIEASVFTPASRIFCIASAGDTARALTARGHHVTAVDINPAQVEYARARSNGAPEIAGFVDRRFAKAPAGLAMLGLRRARVRAFLLLDSPPVQVRFWREHLDTRRWRLALRVVLHPAILRLVYPPAFVAALPPRFDLAVRRRFERTWATHRNRDNPYAWRLLAGSDPPDHARQVLGPAAQGQDAAAIPLPIEWACADAAEYLEMRPTGSFDGFSLSNILDGVTDAYGERLRRAVSRAATPEALVVHRSFGEPRDVNAAKWASQDRSLLWGAVEVATASAWR